MIVVWRVTERCNLTCPFCAYDRRVERPRREASPRAVIQFAEVLAAYQNETGDPVLVSWLGGEPLLWRPLSALTASLRQLGLRLSVTTNGTALASAVMRSHVLEHYAELTVSIDGLVHFHDRSRGWRGGFATLQRILCTLAAEKRRTGSGPLLRVNVVLMRDNVEQFEELCLEVARWGVDEITFNQLGGNDRPEFFPAHRLRPVDVDLLAERVNTLRPRLAAFGTVLRGGERYLARIRSSAAGERLAVDDCGPGERFLFVSEVGIVAPCSFTTDAYGVPIEELTSWRDIVALPFRFAAARTAKRASACGDCPSTQVFDKFDVAHAESSQP
jgi:MoaA/NifB/PqqE/SkfB family radical SAM enzyme